MKILYSNDELKTCIRRLGAEIGKDYRGKDLLVIGLLKGCVVFMSHLLVEIEGVEAEIDFMTISSYKHGTRSEDFKFVQDLDSEVKGRDVLIMEDIIDTGRTLAFTQAHLRNLGANSVATAVLVYKKSNLEVPIEEPKYVGFSYEDKEFIVGFGFDYGGKYRNLSNVYQLEEKDYKIYLSA